MLTSKIYVLFDRCGWGTIKVHLKRKNKTNIFARQHTSHHTRHQNWEKILIPNLDLLPLKSIYARMARGRIPLVLIQSQILYSSLMISYLYKVGIIFSGFFRNVYVSLKVLYTMLCLILYFGINMANKPPKYQFYIKLNKNQIFSGIIILTLKKIKKKKINIYSSKHRGSSNEAISALLSS